MKKTQKKTGEPRPIVHATPVVVEPEIPPGAHVALTVANPMTVLQLAVEGGANVDVLERLLALHERYEASQARKAFDAAMALLRAGLPTIVKGREVDFTSPKGRTHYKHEDLALVTEAVAPLMATVGLSFRWKTENHDKTVTVTCIISHAGGHSEQTALTCAPDDSGNKNAIQALGSAVTYLQRYTLKAALGLAAAADTDGRTPKGKERKAPGPVEPAAQHDGLDKKISAEARQRLWQIVKRQGRADTEIGMYLKASFNLDASADILVRDYDTIIQAIEHPGPLLARDPGQEG